MVQSYHYILIKMAKNRQMKQKMMIPRPGKDVEQLELTCTDSGKVKGYSHFAEQLGSFLPS